MGFAKKKTLNTNAKCINCQLPACNLCTVFEENEDVSGLILGLSVGYCMECLLKTEHGKREDTNLMDDTERSSENFDYEVQLTSSPSQEAINRYVLSRTFTLFIPKCGWLLMFMHSMYILLEI